MINQDKISVGSLVGVHPDTVSSVFLLTTNNYIDFLAIVHEVNRDTVVIAPLDNRFLGRGRLYTVNISSVVPVISKLNAEGIAEFVKNNIPEKDESNFKLSNPESIYPIGSRIRHEELNDMPLDKINQKYPNNIIIEHLIRCLMALNAAEERLNGNGKRNVEQSKGNIKSGSREPSKALEAAVPLGKFKLPDHFNSTNLREVESGIYLSEQSIQPVEWVTQTEELI